MATAASAFDTLATAREFEAAGLERRQAEAVASAVGNAGGHTATKADPAHLATGADLYRALWIQAGAIVAGIAALAGVAFALAGPVAGAAA